MEPGNLLTERIIGCAIEVHRQLGPGLLESTYQTAIGVELDFRRIPFEREKVVSIDYRGVRAGIHGADVDLPAGHWLTHWIDIELQSASNEGRHQAFCALNRLL